MILWSINLYRAYFRLICLLVYSAAQWWSQRSTFKLFWGSILLICCLGNGLYRFYDDIYQCWHVFTDYTIQSLQTLKHNGYLSLGQPTSLVFSIFGGGTRKKWTSTGIWTCDLQLSTLMLYLLSQEAHRASTVTSSPPPPIHPNAAYSGGFGCGWFYVTRWYLYWHVFTDFTGQLEWLYSHCKLSDIQLGFKLLGRRIASHNE